MRRLCVAGLIDSAGTGAFLSTSIIFLTRVAGLSAGVIGLGLSLGAVLGLLTNIPFGTLADRFGPRLVLTVVCVWRAIGYVCFPFVMNVPLYLVVICSLGLVEQMAAPLEQALVGQVVSAAHRVPTMAKVQACRNVGFTIGAMLGSMALLVDDRVGYAVISFVNAASFLVLAGLLRTLAPRPNESVLPGGRTGRLGVLRNRPYLAVAALNGVLTVHMSLLSIGIPLWITQIHVSRDMVGLLFTVNTVVAAALQVRISRGSGTLAGAARCLRSAGVALAACCGLLALMSVVPAVVAIVLAVCGTGALTLGELLQSAGGWTLSYELAPPDRLAVHLSVFSMSYGVQRALAPLIVVGIVAYGAAGFAGLGLLLLVAGLVAPPVTAWAMSKSTAQASVRSIS